MEDERIFQAVDEPGTVGDYALGDLSRFRGIVVNQADSNFEFQAVGEFGPFPHVAVVDDVLLSDDDLGVILKSGDVLIQFLHEQVIKVLDPVILRGQRIAVAVL